MIIGQTTVIIIIAVLIVAVVWCVGALILYFDTRHIN